MRRPRPVQCRSTFQGSRACKVACNNSSRVCLSRVMSINECEDYPKEAWRLLPSNGWVISSRLKYYMTEKSGVKIEKTLLFWSLTIGSRRAPWAPPRAPVASPLPTRSSRGSARPARGAPASFVPPPWAVVDAAVAADRKENDRPFTLPSRWPTFCRTVGGCSGDVSQWGRSSCHHSSTHMDYYRGAVLREHRTASRGAWSRSP